MVRVRGEPTFRACDDLVRALAGAGDGVGRARVAAQTSGLEFFDSAGGAVPDARVPLVPDLPA